MLIHFYDCHVTNGSCRRRDVVADVVGKTSVQRHGKKRIKTDQRTTVFYQ